MNTIVIANLISMIGCILMVYIGFVKEKNRILGLQCVQFFFMGTAHLILGAFSGVIACVVSTIRNLICAKRTITVPLKLLFIGIQVVMSASTLGNGIIEWLPLLANALFVWFIDVKSGSVFKVVIIGAQAMWLAYDLHYMNYVTALFDALTILSNLIGILLIWKAKKE